MPDAPHEPQDPADETAARPWLLAALASAALTVGAGLALHRAAGRPATPRPDRDGKPPGPSLLQEFEANAARIAGGLDTALQALAVARQGLASVGNGGALGRDLAAISDLLARMLGRHPTPEGPARRGPPPLPDLRGDPLLRDPWDGPEDRSEPGGPADHDPRLHRL
ncbi:hypothetical protein [Paracoccus sp. (in: a-proteobacteria)]|uniref:hypothetical protein n=1 Tax=Paracoccus sp. TaxID=267 RepID=UPI0032204727